MAAVRLPFWLKQDLDGLLNVEWVDKKVDGISIIHKKKVQKGASLANTGLLHGDK